MQITNIRARVSFFDSYEKAFERCYEQLKTHDDYPNRIVFAVMGCAVIEYCCNIAISSLRERNSQAVIPSFIGLKHKLKHLVLVISEGQFSSDNSHPTMENLDELIGIRNGIVHKSDPRKTISALPGKNPNESQFEISTVDKHIGKLDPSTVDKYFEAVKSFSGEINRKNTFEEREFIILNKTMKISEVF